MLNDEETHGVAQCQCTHCKHRWETGATNSYGAILLDDEWCPRCDQGTAEVLTFTPCNWR